MTPKPDTSAEVIEVWAASLAADGDNYEAATLRATQ